MRCKLSDPVSDDEKRNREENAIRSKEWEEKMDKAIKTLDPLIKTQLEMQSAHFARMSAMSCEYAMSNAQESMSFLVSKLVGKISNLIEKCDTPSDLADLVKALRDAATYKGASESK